MKAKFITGIGLAALVMTVGGALYVQFRPPAPGDRQRAESLYAVPTLTKEYANSRYGFSVKMPADFTAKEVAGTPAAGIPDTIVLQDAHNNGIQIAVSPFDEDTDGLYTLTKERILKDIPDLRISDEQSVTVGPNYTGIAFRSDNPSFNGASREVWFVFRGNLYQISTYERLDDLLKQLFSTWQFN